MSNWNTRRSRKITTEQIIAALEKNGYTHETSSALGGSYIHFGDYNGTVKSACVVGQAALNLGVWPSDLENIIHEHRPTGHNDAISTLNDSKQYSYKQLVNIIKQWMADSHIERKVKRMYKYDLIGKEHI